jgi:Ni,Fe-hydrogenase III large subunit
MGWWPVTETNIGPYHPFLLEPWKVDLVTEGDVITDAKVTTGYVHRGIEKLLASNPYLRGLHISERVCGICSTVHSQTFSHTVETMFGAEVPERAQYIRVILLELERLHSHYLTLGLMAHAAHQDELFIDAMRNREPVMELMEAITGNRVNLSAITIGGVKRDITPKLANQVKDKLPVIWGLSERILAALDDGQPLAERLKGVGAIDGNMAMKCGGVGQTLRAAGVESDIRKSEPYAAYRDLNFHINVENGGDVLARTLVRARETIESIRLIEAALNGMPDGPIMGELPEPFEAENIGRSEAPRGEVMYYFKANKTNVPERVKIRTPTFANHRALVEMLRSEPITNAQLIIESIDPCLSCTDR